MICGLIPTTHRMWMFFSNRFSQESMIIELQAGPTTVLRFCL